MEKVFQKKYFLYALIFLILTGGLYAVKEFNYLLFHSLTEIFSIVIAVSIFMMAWVSRDLTDNRYYVFLGITFLYVALIDTLHTLSYSGMGIIHGFGNNLPTQLWILARYLQGAALLIAPVFVSRKFKYTPVFLINTLIVGVALASIFYWKNFPDCFLPETGLTPFKIYSEFLICLIFMGAGVHLWIVRSHFDSWIRNLLLAAIGITVISELSFTLYADPYGAFNFIGHLGKLASFYLIYLGVIVTGIRQPTRIFFRKLQQSENAVKTEKEKLLSILESMEDCIYIVNDRYEIEFVNSQMKKMFGEVRGRKCYDYLKGEKQPCPTCRNAAVLAGQSYQWEFHESYNGRIFDVLETPLRSTEGISSKLKIFRDITNRKQAERALAENEEKYRLLFENMIDGFALHKIVLNAEKEPVDYIFLEVNTAFERLTGLRKQDVIGKHVRDVFPGIENDPSDFIAVYGEVALKGEGKAIECYFQKLKKWFSISVYSHKKGFFSTVFEDITLRKKAENVLERDMETLEQMVLAKSQQLLDSQQKVLQSRRLSDIGLLSAMVAHELRNPLASIAMASFNLRKKIQDNHQIKKLDLIDLKVKESDQIICNLLFYSKIKKPERKIHKVGDILKDCMYLLNDKTKKVMVRESLQSINDISVKVDAFQIKEVFQNIFNNALDAMEGVADPCLVIEGEQTDKHVVIKVVDNGKGIEKKSLGKVCEPFFSTKSRGTGLGLAVCLQIIEAHNGMMQINSKQGVGTEVILRLKKEDKGVTDED